MNVRITRLSSSNTNLRTPSVEGNAALMPVVGEPFVMTAAPLDPTASFRLVETSPVTQIIPGGFLTANSYYLLEILL